MSPNDVENTEKYLVNVLKNTKKVENFSELSTEQYVEKPSNILKLAPISYTIRTS